MFNPKYEITGELLTNIKRITAIKTELNQKKYPDVVLMEYARRARGISSHTSTRIEGNMLPLTEVKRILKVRPEHLRDSEREVINYNDALIWLANGLIKRDFRITTSLVKEIHKKVMDGLLPKYNIGNFRSEPVQLSEPSGGGVIYLPPDAKDVDMLINDLIEFVDNNQGKLDAAILAGLVHKQFVIVHPFIDGNGRTARLLSKILLAGLGVDTFNLFSFENYYNKNVTKYFLKVGVFGDYYEKKDYIDFTEWLTYFTEGIVDELLRVKGELDKEDITPGKKLPEHLKRIIAYIEKNGFINDSIYSKLTKRAKATRTLDFKKLISLGLIKRFGKGKKTFYRF